jgi:hypothetical protein
VSNTLEHLLALVNLGDLLIEELVTALTELDNAGIGGDPSCRQSVRVRAWSRNVGADTWGNIPETSLRTFWEMSAATLYLVMVSGFANV